MEEMTIVYFLKKEECAAKKKRRDGWQYFVEEEKLFTPGGDLRLYTVQIPAFFRKRKGWQEKTLTAYLDGLNVPPQGKSVLYVYEGQIRELMQRTTEPLSQEWLLFLLAYYEPQFMSLIVLWDKAFYAEQLVEKYVRNVRYVGFVSKEQEACTALCDTLSEEYGILPQVEQSIKQLHPAAEGCRLIVAADNLYGATPIWLAGECIWLSATANSVAKGICARARNAIYIDIEVFLEDVLRP